MIALPLSVLTNRSVVSASSSKKFGCSIGCVLGEPCINAHGTAARPWSAQTRANTGGLDVSQPRRNIRTRCTISGNEANQKSSSDDENDRFTTRAANLSDHDVISAGSDTSAQETDVERTFINDALTFSDLDIAIRHDDSRDTSNTEKISEGSSGPAGLLPTAHREQSQSAKLPNATKSSSDPNGSSAPSSSRLVNSSTIPQHEHHSFPASSSSEPPALPPLKPSPTEPSPPIAAARAVLAQHLAQHQARSTARRRNPWWTALAALKPEDDDGGGHGGQCGPDVPVSTNSATRSHEESNNGVLASSSAPDGGGGGGGGGGSGPRGPNDSSINGGVREGSALNNGSSGSGGGGMSRPSRLPAHGLARSALHSAAAGLRVLPYASRPAHQPGGRYRELLRRDGGGGWGPGVGGGHNGGDNGSDGYSSSGSSAGGDGDGHCLPAGAKENGGRLAHPDTAPPGVFSSPGPNGPATAAASEVPGYSARNEGPIEGAAGQAEARSLPAPPSLIPRAPKPLQPPSPTTPYNATTTDDSLSLNSWANGGTFSRRLGLPWTALGLLARVLHLNISGINTPRSRSHQKLPQLWDPPPPPPSQPSMTAQSAPAGTQQSIGPSTFQQRQDQDQEPEEQVGALLEWAMGAEGSGRGDLAQWSWVPAPDGRIHSSDQAAEALAVLAAAAAAQARVAAALEVWAEEHPAGHVALQWGVLRVQRELWRMQLALWRPVELLNGRMALLGLVAGLTQQTTSPTPLPLLQQAVQQPLSIPAAFAVIVLLTAVHRQVGHRMRTRGLLMSGRAHRWMGRVAMLGFAGAVVAEATDPAHRPVVQQLREWML